MTHASLVVKRVSPLSPLERSKSPPSIIYKTPSNPIFYVPALPICTPLPHPAHIDTLPAADLLLPAHCPPSSHGHHPKTSSIPVKVGFASFNNQKLAAGK
jgi:hypothetical protein